LAAVTNTHLTVQQGLGLSNRLMHNDNNVTTKSYTNWRSVHKKSKNKQHWTVCQNLHMQFCVNGWNHCNFVNWKI